MKQRRENEPTEKIIKQVRALIRLAEEDRDDSEGQSAFILAQRLMIKHQLKTSDVQDTDNMLIENPIGEERVTIYKRLVWWERLLANIISRNFRVKCFTRSKHVDGFKRQRSTIIFLGHGYDLELAKEIFVLAYDATLIYSEAFVGEQRGKRELKRDYIRGFLAGLDQKFNEQISELKGKYELMVQVPKDVEIAYKNIDWTRGGGYTVPNAENMIAYAEGHEDGNAIDLTKSTLDKRQKFKAKKFN